MKQPNIAGRTLGGAAMRGALAAAAVSALFLAGLLSPGTTESTEPPFDASGISTLSIEYNGVCNPGTLQTAIAVDDTIDMDTQKVIDLDDGGSPGDILGCLGTDDNPITEPETGPLTVLIDSELFDASNIAAETVTEVVNTDTPPFKITIKDLDDDDHLNTFQHDLENGLWPASGNAYLEEELITFTLSGTSMTITARDLNGLGEAKQDHPADSYLRPQGKLKLVGRTQPTYSDGDPNVVSGPTTAAAHAVGATVSNPLTQLTCRIQSWHDPVSGPDNYSARSVCYTRLEPDPPWPDPYNGPLLALSPLFYHNLTEGTIDGEATGETTKLSTVTEVFGNQCFPYVEDELWIRIVGSTTADKDPDNKSLGHWEIQTYNNDTCAGDPTTILGGADGQNMSSTPLVDPDQDTDGDGCSDAKELTGSLVGTEEGTGGKRDPFNQYDFYDLNGDKIITVFDEIIEVANGFGPVGPNDPRDRGPKVPDTDGIDDPDDAFDGPGPSDWNRSKGDGTITVFDDILVVAGQFGHDCR